VARKAFEIHLRGELSREAASELEGLEATVVPAETIVSGFVADQAALYGVLNRLQGLGLELVEVRRLADGPVD
jgi:hypothetical protein